MYLENAFRLNLSPMVSINNVHNKFQILGRNEAINLETAKDWLITRSVNGSYSVSPENYTIMDFITHKMERISLDLLAASPNLGIGKSYDFRAELAMLIVDSDVGKDMTGYEFIRRIKTAAPSFSKLPFGILSINFAQYAKRPASPTPDILMVCENPLFRKMAKSSFMRFYKGDKASHTLHKQTSAAAALQFLNEHNHIALKLKLLLIDIDQLGADMEILKLFKRVFNNCVIVVTIPVVMEEQFQVMKKLFEENVVMITSAPLDDQLVPYLCALM